MRIIASNVFIHTHINFYCCCHSFSDNTNLFMLTHRNSLHVLVKNTRIKRRTAVKSYAIHNMILNAPSLSLSLAVLHTRQWHMNMDCGKENNTWATDDYIHTGIVLHVLLSSTISCTAPHTHHYIFLYYYRIVCSNTPHSKTCAHRVCSFVMLLSKLANIRF